jgi:2-keto-myo-inositol isomerase
MNTLSRRSLLKASGIAAGASAFSLTSPAAIKKNTYKPELSLNMSTIMGQKLGYIREIEIAAAAGFRSCEIWIPTLDAYLKSGGSLKEARKRADDLGMKIQNAIGFAQWIVDDEKVRAQGIEQMKREMDM